MGNDEYRSAEERFVSWGCGKVGGWLRGGWDGTEPIRRFGEHFLRGSYGMAMVPFRIPTVIRRVRDGTGYGDKWFDSAEDSVEHRGGSAGVFAGVILDAGLFVYSVGEALEGNSFPLEAGAAVLACGNSLSGILEGIWAGRKESVVGDEAPVEEDTPLVEGAKASE